eukprot:2863007-Rhodomonas_salina.1
MATAPHAVCEYRTARCAHDATRQYQTVHAVVPNSARVSTGARDGVPESAHVSQCVHTRQYRTVHTSVPECAHDRLSVPEIARKLIAPRGVGQYRTSRRGSQHHTA